MPILIALGLVLTASSWLLSGHFLPWTAFQQQCVFALGVACLGVAAARANGLWQWPLSALAVALLALVPALQFAAGQILFLTDALLPVMFLVGFALSIAIGANLARQQGDRWRDGLMIALLIPAALSTALAALQWLGVDAWPVSLEPLARGMRPYANLGQPNHLATLLGLGFAAALYLFERSRIGAVAVGVVCAWLVVGLLMTQSRTGWLFVALTALWWAVKRSHLRTRATAIVLLGSAMVVGVWAWTAVNRSLLLPEPIANLGNRLDTGLRQGLMRAMLEAIANSPWTGWGFSQVSVAHLSVAFEHEAGGRIYQNAHSVPLDLMLWMGIPLGLLVLLLALRWLWQRGRACADGPCWALVLGIGAIGVHSLTEYPLDYSYFLLTLGLLVGTVEGTLALGRNVETPKAVFVLPSAAVVAILLWIGVEYMRAEDSARQIRFVLAGVGVDKVSHVPPPEVVLLDGLRAYHVFWSTPAREGMTADEVAWMKKVVVRNPNPPAMLRYALAAGLNGQPEEAQRMLRAICHVHPQQRCVEARESWGSAQRQHAVLRDVPLP